MKAGGIILKKNDSPAFFQSRLTDAVSVILSELLSYEHPPKPGGSFYDDRIIIQQRKHPAASEPHR